jgi:DNA-binding NarL/FixJ family response regulator
MDESLALGVLRVAREALTNIVRHAQARSVRLGLMYEQAAVTLLVQDDGQGFDPRADWPGDRFGLRALSERARVLGAAVDVDSLAGWGTRIRARFPYRLSQEQAVPRLRVLIASSRPLLRAGVARLLSGTDPGLEVVGEAATAAEALDACADLRPDVVLADLGLGHPALLAPDGAGQDIAGLLLGQDRDLAVVGLCEVGDEKLVASAIRAGARGCVDTGADGPELARALIAAGRGQAILSGPALQRLHRGLRDDASEPALTDRERQVRGLMEQGLPDKLIAEKLVLSIRTVEKHAGAVLRKTGARNRTELAALAGQARLRQAAR